MATSNLALSGLASGFDWQSVITQLVAVERSPETQWQAQQSALAQQNIAPGGIKTELGTLQNALTVLKDPTFFDSRTATASDAALASATADSGTALGTYGFNVSQLASAAVWKGTAGVSGPLSSQDDVSALTLSAAPFAQAVTAGTFTVNGKQITIATGDTLKSVFDQISTATDGAVTASYSSASDKITLSGSAGIVLGSGADTSNFLQVAKLSNNGTGSVTSAAKLGSAQVKRPLSQGNFATAVNDGPELTSQTNTITGDSSGISGLSVTALDNGDFTVTVAGDTAKIKTAITNFVNHYNRVQSMINTETASTTDSTGKVTSGTLAGDQDTADLNTHLRELMNSTVGGLSGTLKRLESLGFVSNGFDDALSTSDLSGLDNALATNLPGLKDLFSNPSSGLAVQMDSFLTSTIGDHGSLVAHQTNLKKQSSDIDTQISDMEDQIAIYQQQLTDGFVAMEVAQSKINQQLSFLTKTFFGSTSTTG
jgi:flagellar hook-associated protein 2